MAFRIMHDTKKVAQVLLDVSPQNTKGRKLAIKFRGQKIKKKGRIIFQRSTQSDNKVYCPLMAIIKAIIKKIPKTLNKPTGKTPGI